MNENLKTSFDAFIENLTGDPSVVAYRQAKEAYAKNGALMNRVVEYNAQAQALETENGKADKDQLLIASISRRLKELYDEIISNPDMVKLNETEQEINELLTEINYSLKCAIAPESMHEHDDCGGDCGHCGGCH